MAALPEMTALRPSNATAADTPAGAAFRGCDLIFVSLENWDEIWRRNQFLCDALATRFPESRILFVGPPRDVSSSIRRGRLGELAAPAKWVIPGHPNITVTRPLKWLPNSLTAGQRFNERLAVRHVRRVAREVGLRDPLLWLNPHHAVSMVGHLGERAVIYDITDDWTQLDQSSREARLITSQDAELCRRADAVIVCSEQLLQSKRPLARNLHLIPNGVHTAHYATVADRSLPLPPDAASWPRPVLGYTGTVHASRVDVELVEKLARRFPTGTIALVGPDFLPSEIAARLDALGNVRRVPPVPYARIPEYMRAFDVCIVPHRVSPFTESLNPIKLWEYLAAGKPVVSTPVPGFRDYPQHVHLGADLESFSAGIEAALREDPARCAARREEAQHHSWDCRVDAVVKVIAASLERTAHGR
jgi:glycosyltransferase involved in cell wall biosynthesis